MTMTTCLPRSKSSHARLEPPTPATSLLEEQVHLMARDQLELRAIVHSSIYSQTPLWTNLKNQTLGGEPARGRQQISQTLMRTVRSKVMIPPNNLAVARAGSEKGAGADADAVAGAVLERRRRKSKTNGTIKIDSSHVSLAAYSFRLVRICRYRELAGCGKEPFFLRRTYFTSY